MLMFLNDTCDYGGQVALQVGARSEEVGDDEDALHTLGDELIGSLFEAGSAEFQEGRFDKRETARAGQTGRSLPHRLIGRFDAGAVGEDDDGSDHALVVMKARM